MSQSSDEEDATSRKQRKIEETEETLMHRETPEISSKATPIEDEDGVILKNIKTEDRLEDVFQDETIKAFTMIVDFEKFARSKRGLCLEEYDLTCIKENEKNVEAKKMAMLNRWREINEPKATAMEIRFLVERFRNHLYPNSKDFIKLSNGAFVMYVKKPLGHENNVFLGEQTSEFEGCSHPCVIKLTHLNLASLREAKALTKLRNHDNVVSILRVGEYRERLYKYIYIAMDLAWTRRLRDVLEKCKQLNSDDQIINLYRPLDLVFQILKGLVHIHDHCIIHRDLKPENVLVSEDYKNIKLNDFGICKQIDDDFTTEQTNQDVGTEGYSAPETYNKSSEISLSSDVYSVGIMIAEMISNGQHPFGNDPLLWKHKIKQKMSPDLGHLCISNKSQMKELLKQMMHLNPIKRPTAKEVLNDAALEQAQIRYPLSFGSPEELSTIQKVEERWTQIEGTDIKYDQASFYRKSYKVFDAIRESGADKQETVVKFVLYCKTEEKQIQREIDILWETHIHDNVVTYFQSGKCEYKGKNAIFILMEKCDAKTLYERIKEENLPYIEREKTVKCIAQGLQHLKGKKILHRDLKPQNILYRGDVAVVSDFGLSKKISRNKSRTRKKIGTSGWAAPETYLDNVESSYAADIYSAGLVFFFALTNGKHPYGDCSASWETYIKDDLNFNLKPLYKTPDGIVAYDLISLMLSRNPENRPPIEEVLEHPFFWDVEKKKEFYADICSIIELHKENKKGKEKIEKESMIFSSQPLPCDRQTVKYLEEVGPEVSAWKAKLELTAAEEDNVKKNINERKGRELSEITIQKNVMQVLAQNRPDLVTSMVIFIRNRFTHEGEDKRKEQINLTDKELWEFFDVRYPHLFIYTYYARKEYFKSDLGENRKK